MKILTILVALILLFVSPLSAQKPIQNLPELEEWFSISGVGGGISYLPNFDTEHGGKNAIAVRTNGDPTWYLRYPSDTVNLFSWSYEGTYKVAQADLNGDGINDYVDARGFVYQGVVKNQPPKKVPVAQPIEHLNMHLTVTGDFNGDGYEDIITRVRSSMIEVKEVALLLLGNPDLTKLKVLWIVDQHSTKDMLIGTYITATGEARIVTYRLSGYTAFEGFVLESLDFTGAVQGDTLRVRALDSVGHYLKAGEKPTYDELYSALYHSSKYQENTLIIKRKTGGTGTYSIENDKLKFIRDGGLGSASFSGLTASIDGDDKEDFVGRGAYIRGSITRQGYFLISGNPAIAEYPPRAFFVGECVGDGVGEAVRAIGDVTGDGIGDVAYIGGREGCLRIYKGINWQAISVTEDNHSSNFRILSTEPNPIGISRTATLPITIEQSGVYTLSLYDGSGKLVGELFKGELPACEQRFPLNLKSYNLAAGFYTIRLSDGKHTSERGILLTNQ